MDNENTFLMSLGVSKRVGAPRVGPRKNRLARLTFESGLKNIARGGPTGQNGLTRQNNKKELKKEKNIIIFVKKNKNGPNRPALAHFWANPF